MGSVNVPPAPACDVAESVLVGFTITTDEPIAEAESVMVLPVDWICKPLPVCVHGPPGVGVLFWKTWQGRTRG